MSHYNPICQCAVGERRRSSVTSEEEDVKVANGMPTSPSPATSTSANGKSKLRRVMEEEDIGDILRKVNVIY